MKKTVSIDNNFSCQMCGKCCSNKWQIFVTEQEKQKMNKGFDEHGEPELKENIVKLDEERFTFKHAGDACCFLTEENKCYLHKNYGEMFFCNVCRTYPRSYTKYKKTTYATIDMSCEHYSKLLDKELTFSERDGGFTKDWSVTEFLEGFEFEILFGLMPYTIDILQFKDIDIKEKVKLIYFMFEEVALIMKENATASHDAVTTKIVDFVEQFMVGIKNNAYTEILGNMVEDYISVMAFFITYLNKTATVQHFLEPEKLKLVQEFFDPEKLETRLPKFMILIESKRAELQEVELMFTNALIHIMFSCKKATADYVSNIKKMILFYFMTIIFASICEENITKQNFSKYISLSYLLIYHSNGIADLINEIDEQLAVPNWYAMIL